MKRLATFLFFAFTLSNLSAQTNVSGGIYANTTWTLANSPYIVVDTVVVFPGVTLTIEPGVVVKFDDDVRIEIRQSTFIALGTVNDSITFTSNSTTPVAGIWSSIYFNNAVSIQLNYGVFMYAQSALSGGCPAIVQNMSFRYNLGCFDGATRVNNCSFYFNGGCFTGGVFVDSCIFVNNQDCIYTNGEIHLTNSEFYGNGTGLTVPVTHAGHTAVINCTFCSNETAVSNSNFPLNGGFDPYTDSIFNCNFSGNHLGFYGGFSKFILNVLTDNDTAYEGFHPDSAYMFGNYIMNNGIGMLTNSFVSPYVHDNAVCGNHTYNVRYTNVNNGSFTGLCFCTTDSAAIAATIYDGYDDISLGLLTFMPVASCDSSLFVTLPPINCASIATNAQTEIPNPGSAFTIFPNPATNQFTITSPVFAIKEISIYNVLGEKVYSVTLSGSRLLSGEARKQETINCKLQTGIYFVRVISAEKTFTQKLIIQ